MPLYCPDGATAEITPWTPMPVLKPREFRPPEPERDRCQRESCRRLAWQHWTVRP